jgi:hypothetical protein
MWALFEFLFFSSVASFSSGKERRFFVFVFVFFSCFKDMRAIEYATSFADLLFCATLIIIIITTIITAMAPRILKRCARQS